VSSRDQTQGELIVLALNAGSSSLKFGLFRAGLNKVETLLSGSADAIGEPATSFSARDGSGALICHDAEPISGQEKAFDRVSALFGRVALVWPQAIAHRIVHGGPRLLRHCRIDDDVVVELEKAAQFAPLHVPSALTGIRHAKARFRDLPQIACFDTAFHAELPDVSRVLPIARDLERQGLRRYGFHGLSCESILHQIGPDCPSRVIIAHLGSGASITAVRDGKSADTSMGLTPAGGVVMATRSGDLDPGVLVYLLRQKRFDADQLEQEIDHRAGLYAVSGLSGDMRALRKAAGNNADARLAIAMFSHSVRKEIAAMAAVLGGVDLLVFTGGIGENDPRARHEICEKLDWMGLALDEGRDRQAQNPTGADRPPVKVLVLPSREEEQMARDALRVVNG
jgi:acetate kinase